MRQILALAIVLGMTFLAFTTANAQEIGFPLATYPASSYPAVPVGPPGAESRTYWPEPLPLLSTYPLTPSVLPVPQLQLPRLAAYGTVVLPQPVTANALTTSLLTGPFSTQISFAGSFSWPVDRPFLASRFDPLVLTSGGVLRPLLVEPICREDLLSPAEAFSPLFLRLR
jgi:hypothetical protein